MDKTHLAVYNYKDEIIQAIQDNQVVVIEAPTGSGKTTQLPQIIFEAGLDKWGIVGVTQPRRIAAYGVSKRIAEEMNVELGQLVGYKMRFDDCTSANTKIKIMTDGILLEELRSDPMLLKYSIIIVDEAHERSLNIDFILGLLKDILKKRDDFKVLVSSATINAQLFSDYFNGAPVISVKTSPFPVEEKYFKVKDVEDSKEQISLICSIMGDIENKGEPGDVLIFLPGEGAIKDCCSQLEMLNRAINGSMVVMPLYARLSPEDQNRVFDVLPEGKRKVVVATNIAETSITINGIVHVIDPGYAKINYYNPRTFTSYLELKPISRASCDQRKGRAGRTAPGVVYRLFSREEYERREEYTKEEIYRTDLSEVVLRMLDLGINNYESFDFISRPGRGAIQSAMDTLISLGAVDSLNCLTSIGKMMVDFPLMPRLARILLEGMLVYPEVLYNVLIVIAFLSAKKPFLYPRGEEIESQRAQKKLYVKGGDFFTWINVFYKYQKSQNREQFCKAYYLDQRVMDEILNIHYQLSSILEKREVKIGTKFNQDQILLCICSGLKQYICRRPEKKKNGFMSMTELDIRIHPGSFLYYDSPIWLVGGEIVNTGRTYVRSGALVPEKLVKNMISDVYLALTNPQPVKKNKALVAVTTTKSKKDSNYETRISLFDKYFDLEKDRNESYYKIPYSIIIQLRDKKSELIEMDFGKKKARLFYKDTLIVQDYFSAILKYFDVIPLDNGLNVQYPGSAAMVYPDDWNQLFRYLKKLSYPTVKRGKRAMKASFMTLRKIDDDAYQYFLERDIYESLETSINALNDLLEENVPAWTEDEKKEVERVYNELSRMLNDISV